MKHFSTIFLSKSLSISSLKFFSFSKANISSGLIGLFLILDLIAETLADLVIFFFVTFFVLGIKSTFFNII